MRKIVTAVTAASLALSMLAMAVPASAVTGFDSAYAGESAFVNISAGQTQNFQVFFANTGTTTWSRGTSTQVDLAACLEDKVTCNAQDATEASWNSGWLSATRYATTTQTTTAPGSLGTFSYNITAPVGAANGIYHFNGDLVLSSTGERIHPEGYFQDANLGGVQSGAATITSLTPNNGTSNGGTSVVIAGSGIVCTPAFPAVSFGGTNAVVSSCGSTSLTAVSPAHAPGAVTVTVTNSGALASNGLTFTFNDTTKPTFTAVAVAGNLVTVTFSEPVCRAIAWTNTNGANQAVGASGDWNINNISSGTADIADTGDNIPLCVDNPDGVTTATIVMGPSVTPGAFVEVTLNENPTAGSGSNTSIVDIATPPNTANAPQARQATASTPETTAPTITSASGAVGTTTVTVNFSEAVFCTAAVAGDFVLTDNDTTTVDPTITAITGCKTSQVTADSSIDLTTSISLAAARTFQLNFTGTGGTGGGDNEIQDIALNDLADCVACTTFTTGAADFTPPTMIDARMANNLGSSDFADSGDSFTLTFSEKMNGGGSAGPPAQPATIFIQDQDGTTAAIECAGGTPGPTANVAATCDWDTTVTTVTVTLTAALTTTAVGTNGSGTTQGMQIPFNITALNGITDTSNNPPNVLGSSDRLVDFE